MNDQSKGASKVDKTNVPTDEQLSSLYQQSMQSVETRAETDQTLLLMAQAKAQSIKTTRQNPRIPFFGSEAFRGWTSAAAFSIVGIGLWVTLQAPTHVFQEPVEATSAWDSSQPIEELEVREQAPMMLDEHSLELDQESFSQSRELYLSTPGIEESTDNAFQEAMEAQQRAKKAVLETNRRAQQQKSRAPSAELVLKKRMARGADPELQRQPQAKAALPAGYESKEANLIGPSPESISIGAARDESASEDESSQVLRDKLFDQHLLRLRVLIDSEQWLQSKDLYQQLIDDYSEFEIPAEIVDGYEKLRLTKE